MDLENTNIQSLADPLPVFPLPSSGFDSAHTTGGEAVHGESKGTEKQKGENIQPSSKYLPTP